MDLRKGHLPRVGCGRIFVFPARKDTIQSTIVRKLSPMPVIARLSVR